MSSDTCYPCPRTKHVPGEGKDGIIKHSPQSPPVNQADAISLKPSFAILSIAWMRAAAIPLYRTALC